MSFFVKRIEEMNILSQYVNIKYTHTHTHNMHTKVNIKNYYTFDLSTNLN